MEIDYLDLEKKIKEIVRICEDVPEGYRIKCFEYLIENVLLQKSDKLGTEVPPEPKKEQKISLSIDVRAFLSQYSLEENVIDKLFLMEGGEIRHLYKITTTTKAKAQMQVALLMALENTIKDPNKKFGFSSEEVRQRCSDLQCYDLPNFATHFKKNKEFFKSLDDLEHIVLSSEGKAELAEVITQMINEQG